MATKAAAIQSFFEGFGIPAYTATNVPDDAEFPYLTYEGISGAWDDGEQNITVNLWYRTDSESIPNAKAEQIAERIGLGGYILGCDKGLIWLKRGAPFCQSISETTDDKVKRRYINISVEFLTLS